MMIGVAFSPFSTEPAGLEGVSGAAWLWAAAAGASLSCVPFLYAALPRSHRRPAWRALCLLASLAVFLPGVGVLGTLWVILAGLRRARPTPPAAWERFSLPDLPYEAGAGESAPFGRGGVPRALLRGDAERRMLAVFATRRLTERDAVRLLRHALRDPVEEVRLLAYAELEKKERGLTDRITAGERRLAELGDDADLGARHERLAGLYWELSYLGLLAGGSRAAVLDRARTYAQRAQAEEVNPAAMELLLGRIAMALEEWDRAAEHLERARNQGIPAVRVMPYLAETRFHLGRFGEVRAALEAIPEGEVPGEPLASLRAFWLGAAR